MAPKRERTNSGSRAILLTLLMAAGLVVLLFGLRSRSAQWLAAYWQEQLESVPEDRAGVVVDRIAQLGPAGLPVLVQSLDSQRELVARAAKRELWDQLKQWEELRPWKSSPQVACLAQALADQIEHFSPVAQKDAADLAARILYWPLDDRVVDVAGVLADCEKVFRSTGLPRPKPPSRRPSDEPTSLAGADERSGGAESPDAARESSATASLEKATLRQLAKLSAGGLPAAPSATAPDADRQRPTPTAGQDAGQTPAARSSPSPGTGVEPVGNVPTSAMASHEFLRLETIEVMRGLRAADARTAQNARSELERRGFTEVQIELARQLFDPDPEARKQLARMLPQLHSVSAAPWLLWLSRDADADVRLVAITLLATTGDPAVLTQLERIAGSDPDPRIQDQVLRMAQQRNEGRDGALR